MKEAHRFRRHRIARTRSAGKPSRSHERARCHAPSPSRQGTASIGTITETDFRVSLLASDTCNRPAVWHTRCPFVGCVSLNAHSGRPCRRLSPTRF